jgi:hypothetical protein
MKKIITIILKVVLSLILLSSVLGVLGIFPAPTAEMYSNPEAFNFINMLETASYISYIMAIVNVLAIVALWMRREALAAILILPIVVNIIGFHAFLDGGLFTAGAIMGNVLFLLNLYFIWAYRAQYKSLLARSS